MSTVLSQRPGSFTTVYPGADASPRLEIAPSEMDRVLRREVIDELARRFRALGFDYVTLDLQGYRTGAMNEVLKQTEKGDPHVDGVS